MSNMANQIAERMRQEGIDTSQSVSDAMGGSSAQGTGGEQVTPQQQTTPPAGASNTDGQQAGGTTPDTIPYSRFQEVNTRLQELRQYEDLGRLGISPDSAVRLANFEASYLQDPTGTLSLMIDQQDLPDAQKTALKALLQQQRQAEQDGALEGDQQGQGQAPQLPEEVTEAVNYVREMRTERQNADTQARLSHMVRHWAQQDETDQVTGVTERQKLLYIQNVASSGAQFATLEAMAEAARTAFLEDRDSNLGSAVNVQRRGTGTPLAVPSGGLPPTGALPDPKNMTEARQRIMADIASGRLPDLSPEG